MEPRTKLMTLCSKKLLVLGKAFVTLALKCQTTLMLVVKKRGKYPAWKKLVWSSGDWHSWISRSAAKYWRRSRSVPRRFRHWCSRCRQQPHTHPATRKGRSGVSEEPSCVFSLGEDVINELDHLGFTRGSWVNPAVGVAYTIASGKKEKCKFAVMRQLPILSESMRKTSVCIPRLQ